METTLGILIILAVFVLFCVGLAVVLRCAYRTIKKGVINVKNALTTETRMNGADSSSSAKSTEASRTITQKIKSADLQNQGEEAERRTREEAERCAREEAERRTKLAAQQVHEETERQNSEASERLARETAERRGMEEAELQAYREAVRRKQDDIERQEKAEIVTRKAIDTPERVVHDKSSSHYQSSRQWPKVNNEACARENAHSSTRMVHSQVTEPKVSKSSSHYETSKDWPAVEQTESERKGFAFERFVDAHFPNKFFKRLEWRSDIKDVDGRLSESSKYPDLEYEIRKSGVRFAVECKWRQSFLRQDGKQIIWWARDEKQIINYVQYGKRQTLDVIVIIGIGGTPDEPDKVYSMPLSKLSSPYITKEELWDYFVGKQSSFFLVPEDHNIRLYNKK